MNKPTAVNYTGTQTPYGTKHDNIEIGDASIDYRDNDSGLIWYNSPETTGKYMIFSAANDNGYMTATPLFWVCDQTDQELLRLVNGLPGRRGETPFTTAIQATDWLNGEPNYYLLTGEGGGGGGAGWLFYSDEGELNAPPPTDDGNVIFRINSSPVVETYNPNKANGVSQIYFILKDSAGTDYTTQFTTLQTNGGTITMTQGANVAAYTSVIPGTFFVDSINGIFVIQTDPATQTVTSASPFVSGVPITLSFS
jgi:hypothetical protein